VVQPTASLTLPAALPLECGQLLQRPVVSYETYGELQGDNGILLLHGISRSHRAAGAPGKSAYEPDGWFQDVIGRGGALDPSSVFVISANLLGSPFGSTSPASADIEGRAWKSRFPPISVTDSARAMAALVYALGVRRLKAVVGVSLGGMVAIRLASLFPEVAPAVVAIAACLALPDSVRGRLGLTRQMLAGATAFRGGEYEDSLAVAPELRRVRLTALRDLYGHDYLIRTHGSVFNAERALEAEADAFAQRFDANAYAALCQCAATCDLTEVISDFPAKALFVACNSDDFAPASRVRESYHMLTAAGAKAAYWELNSDAGHRAPYLEAGRLNGPMREFLARK
jgi:homoserine O-acetyltransferase/O-succinyltransferase